MCGIVRGDGRVGGALRMAVTAEWHGEIHALAAVIAGKISGKLWSRTSSRSALRR